MAIVVQISDVHLRERAGVTSRGDPDAALAATIGALRATDVQPDLFVLTGDLADDGSAAACRRLLDAVAPWRAPILAVAGNHDLPEVVTEVFGSPTTQQVGGWSIVALDTHLPGAESGRIDADRAAARLDAAAERFVLVVLHHPPASPSCHEVFGLAGADELLDVCAARPGVRALASGHLHQSFDLIVRGVRVVGAPSTWYAMEHHGRTYHAAPGGAVGARIWHLAPDGTLTHELVRHR